MPLVGLMEKEVSLRKCKLSVVRKNNNIALIRINDLPEIVAFSLEFKICRVFKIMHTVKLADIYCGFKLYSGVLFHTIASMTTIA